MNAKSLCLWAGLLFLPFVSGAELAVTLSPIKTEGQKTIVSLVMRNNFAEVIESARAAVFLLDENGKLVGQASKWVIGGTSHTGSEKKRGLPSGGTNSFYFVITATKPFTTTNFTAKVSFSRVVLEGGKLADMRNAVKFQP